MWRRACGCVGEAERRSRMRRTSRGPSRRAPAVHEGRLRRALHGRPARPRTTPAAPPRRRRASGTRRCLLPLPSTVTVRPRRSMSAAVEAAELRDAQPGGVEQLEHGQVARRSTGLSAGTSSSDVISPLDRTRGGGRHRTGPASAGRIGREVTLPHLPGEVAAQCRRLPGDGGTGQLARPQRGEVAPQVHAVDALGTVDVAAGHPVGEGSEVAHVRPPGRRGAPAQPGGKPRQIPVARHGGNRTAPTQGFLGTNVAREPSGGPFVR